MLRRLRARYRQSLRLKFIVPVYAALVIAFGLVAVTVHGVLSTSLRNEARSAAEAHANRLTTDADVVTVLARGDEHRTAELLVERCRHALRVELLAGYLRNPGTGQLELVAAVGPADHLAPTTAALDEHGPRWERMISAPSDAELALVVAPVPTTSTPAAVLAVGVSTRESAVLAGVTYARLLAVLAALLLFVGMFADRMSRQILGPLLAINRALKRIVQGRLDERLEVIEEDDIGHLARHFNALAGRLQHDQSEIQRHAESLEQRVHERTAELQTALEELRTLEHAKDSFLSSVSHEMRTPLTSILASAEILRDFADDDPEAREEFLEIITREANRMLEIIGSMIDLARLEAQAFRLELAPVDLRDVVHQALGEAHRRHGDGGVVLAAKLPAEPVECPCDRERVLQVLRHLVRNAIAFSPEGSTVEAAITLADESFVEIVVRDEGPGVPDDERDAIFTKFGQVGCVLTDKPDGLGLGLSISSSIAKAHGGSLRYVDEDRNGATFALRLPRTPVEARLEA